MFFIFSIGFGICIYGQMTKNDIIGQWSVKKIVRKSPNPELRGVLNGFKYATFSFMENGDFDLKTESKAPAFRMILMMTENANWKFNPEEQLIKIGTEEDSYSIMGIYPNRNGSVIEFLMDESEMVFEMEKAY